MPDITEFLVGMPDHRNWSVVLEPDEHRSSRYWMIKFPRGEHCRALFIYELSEGEGMWMADGFKDGKSRPVTRDDLEFWYYAQRDYNDW